MSLLAQSTAASVPKTTTIQYLGIVAAFIFVSLAVAQLYSYEDFPEVIASLWLPGGRQYAGVWAAVLVIMEVGALPFFLMLRLSPLMRLVSMIAGWLASLIWLILLLWLNVSASAVSNSGVLGATLPVTPEWWLVVVFGLLSALVAYVSWGMGAFSELMKQPHRISSEE